MDSHHLLLAKWPSPTPWLIDRYTDFIELMPKNGIAVEVGVQSGKFAAHMLKTNPQKLYLIDCWQHQDPQVYDDPLANISNDEQENLYTQTFWRFAHEPRVVLIRDFSKNAVQQFQDESLDWVYIDANHGYSYVKEDIALWWPKVKRGGILSGHDYILRESFGVVQAVNEFLIDQGLYFAYLTNSNDHDSWAIRKP